jgi:chromate reductase, NAD(P)H dehydrogenase (quinone)
MKSIKFLVISGSLRNDSYNRKALKLAVKIAKEYGAELKEFDLKIYPLPLFDQDLNISEQNNVLLFKKEIDNADILMISSPEYNHSVSGVLKNAIDWASTDNNSFSGKTAIIFGASKGIYGTVRMQQHLRQILTALNVYMEPQPQVFIGNAEKVFDINGNLNDSKLVEQLTKLIERTIVNFRIKNGI